MRSLSDFGMLAPHKVSAFAQMLVGLRSLLLIEGNARPSIADDRRAQIVEAFLECIRRHGLAGATMERVAEALGVSRTLVFHYFGDSEALMRAATEKIFEQTLHRLRTSVVALPTTERGRAMLDFIFAGPHLASFET